MSFRYPQPSNESDFELFCKRFLRRRWKGAKIQRLGKRGERQYGIDLIDISGQLPLKAAQCKHHESTKTLPFAEVSAEVDEALKYSVKIDEFVILSTARKTEDLQTKILTLNQEHAQKGLFSVTVLTWQDIEEELDELGEDERDEVLRGDLGRKNSDLRRVFSEAVLDNTISVDAIDRELEDIKKMSDQHDYKSAEIALERIRDQKWDKLNDRQKYRHQAYLANLRIAQGKYDTAGNLLLGAVKLQPTDERARVNEALAYEILGDNSEAFKRSAELITEFPISVPLYAIWIRNSPTSTSLVELEYAIPPSLQTEPEIAIALAHAASKRDEPEAAARFANVAVQKLPELPQAWMSLAQASHKSALLAKNKSERQRLLSEAVDQYTKAIDRAKSSNLLPLASHLLLNRGIVYDLLSEEGLANSDYWESSSLDKTDPEPFRRRALHLIDEEKFDDAIRVLNDAPVGKDSERVLILLASALYERSAGNDLESAIALCVKQASIESELSFDFIELGLRAYVKAGQINKAESFLKSDSVNRCSQSGILILNALYLHLTGKKDDAREAAKLAIAKSTLATNSEMRLLGRLAPKFGLDNEAIPILQKVLHPGWFDAYTRLLLDCCKRTGNHDILLRVYEEQRDLGLRDKGMLYDEIALLQTYDPSHGLDVIESLLVESPEDQDYLLWRSLYGLLLNRNDLLCTDLNRLPKPANADPGTIGKWVIGVLIKGGMTVEALRYAYDLLRFHFNDPDAHNCYLGLFLQQLLNDERPRTLLDCDDQVRPGYAVGYTEGSEESVNWIVLQDEQPLFPEQGEKACDSTIGVELIGKKIGDTFVLAPGSIQNRIGTIKEIKSKYIHLYHDCMNGIQIRFPDQSTLQMVRVAYPGASPDAPGQFDFTPIIEDLKKRREYVEDKLALYASQPVSIHLLSAAVGRDSFQTMDHLLNSPSLPFRCCSGTVEERTQAFNHLASKDSLVLDLSGLYMLGFLELAELLASSKKKVIVSQGTWRALLDIREKLIPEKEPSSIAVNEIGLLSLTEAKADEVRAYKAKLDHLIALVDQHCTIESCPEMASLEQNKRHTIRDIFGIHGLESLLLAKRPNRILWTDDWTLAGFGTLEFGIKRVWTQVALTDYVDQQLLELNRFNEASAKLVAHGYDFAWWNPDVLRSAGKMAFWNCDDYPLKQLLDQFSSPRIDLEIKLRLATVGIANVFSQSISTIRKIALTIRICEKLSCSGENVWPVTQLKDLLQRVLDSDITKRKAVIQTIDIWLMTRET